MSVEDESTREELLAANNAPSLPNVSVYACRGCLQCYWWSERPNSSASRVKNAASHLFRLALRAGVPYQGNLGMFDFIDPEAEREQGSMTFPRVEAFEWLKSSELTHPFKLRSAYATEDGSELLPFTNVTSDFVGTLDYIFYEPQQWTQIEKLDVPTTFTTLNWRGIPNGHLIPSDTWPSDHLAIGATFAKTGVTTVEANLNSATENGAIIIANNPHKRTCQCGCVPNNIFSLFEMAEMRKQLRAQQKAAQKK